METKTEQPPQQPEQVQTSEVKATLKGIQTIPVPIVAVKAGPHALPQPQPKRKHNRRQQTLSYPGYMGPNMWTSPPYGEQQKNYKSYFGLN